MVEGNSCVKTLEQFIDFCERFISKFPALDQTEKLRLLIHFYIDALSCWSLENFYLSGSTLLQIIASTEEDGSRPFAQAHAVQRGIRRVGFFDHLAGAADKIGIAPLAHDVVKIRNSLIHEGTLNSGTFIQQMDAAIPISDAMNWVDEYVYGILGLGKVPVPRHSANDYAYALNSFSF
jgi:hypothetical protein